MTDLTMDPNLPAPPLDNGAPVPSSWQEQDIILRDMWTQNKTQQEIADALGRSVPAIMTRAARLGLPRRSAPGRKPGQRTSNHAGAGAYSAIRRPPRTSTSSAAEAPQTSPRVCLMCLKKFESFGRHNRICSSCKGTAEYETASALPNIHISSS
jgi:hypothetical protein